MSNRKLTAKELYSHCFSDLQRSAVSFYLNPKGKTHQIFLAHALKLLKDLKTPQTQKFVAEITDLKRKTISVPKTQKERMNLADKILTYGSLMRP